MDETDEPANLIHQLSSWKNFQQAEYTRSRSCERRAGLIILLNILLIIPLTVLFPLTFSCCIIGLLQFLCLITWLIIIMAISKMTSKMISSALLSPEPCQLYFLWQGSNELDSS